MGGGERNVKEVPKRLRPVQPEAGNGPDGGSGARPDLTAPICEREQIIAFRLTGPVARDAQVAIHYGQPLVVVAGGRVVGHLTDAKQDATLMACLDDGYSLVGRVVAIDPESIEGFATVVGVRSL